MVYALVGLEFLSFSFNETDWLHLRASFSIPIYNVSFQTNIDWFCQLVLKPYIWKKKKKVVIGKNKVGQLTHCTLWTADFPWPGCRTSGKDL